MNELRAHVLTGVPVRRAMFRKGSGGLAADESGAPKGLPPTEPGDEIAPGIPDPEVIATDNPELDGTMAELPSENTGTYDASAAIAFIKVAGAVQDKTGAKFGGIDFSVLAAAMASGSGLGAALGGPAGAIAGAIIGLFMYVVQAEQAVFDAQPWNAYAGTWRWMERYLPPMAQEMVWADRPDVVAAGIPAVCEYVASKMLMPAEDDGTYRTYIDNYIRAGNENGQALKGKVLVDTETLLWRNRDGVAVPMIALMESMGGFEACDKFYTKAGVDYPLTRLHANPAGSESAATPGVVSDGTGDVYMLKAAMYLYDSDGDGIPDTNVNPNSSGAAGAIAAGLLLMAMATKKPTSRKSR